MNVIVSNKQKGILDDANIDAIKELTGFFSVDDLINNFKYYFFSKIIIDATGLVDFANPEVLKKLCDEIGAEKIILFLPPNPVPPVAFLQKLVELGIYNFTTNIQELVKLIQIPNTINNVKQYVNITKNVETDMSSSINNNDSLYVNNALVDNNESFINTISNKLIIGFKNVTNHAGSTTLIYMIKKYLEKNFNKNVLALEVDSNDFVYYKSDSMISVNSTNFENVIKNYNSDIILVDLSVSNYDNLCNKVVYLVEPSTIKINKLMVEDRKSFAYLQGKLIVLNKSLLSVNEVKIFSNEAGVPIFFNMPPLNDRIDNEILGDFLIKLGVLDNTNKKRGLFNTFE